MKKSETPTNSRPKKVEVELKPGSTRLTPKVWQKTHVSSKLLCLNSMRLEIMFWFIQLGLTRLEGCLEKLDSTRFSENSAH